MGFETKAKLQLIRNLKNLNFVPMGFETRQSVSSLYQGTEIWTLSLWDLKRLYAKYKVCQRRFELCPYGIWNDVDAYGILQKLNHLNFVPMGFETRFFLNYKLIVSHLNFVPMGFETVPLNLLLSFCFIWTLSLWDLKRQAFKMIS